MALTALWRSYGVQPDAVIGHSMGEVTAAVVAGALSPADGLRVIATRSRLMSRLAGQGAMALLELDAAGRRGVDRRLSGGDGGGVCLAASDRDRRAARTGRGGDRGGGTAGIGWRGGSRWMWPRIIAIIDPMLPELRSARLPIWRRSSRPSRSSAPSPTRPGGAPLSTPSIGRPICVIRCGSVRPSPLPAPSTAPSWRSARIRCSPTPSTTPWPTCIITASARCSVTPTTR